MSTIQVNEILSRDGTKTLMKLDSGAMSGVNFGRRNMLINGDFKVWQRGTSGTTAGNTAYYTDRFKVTANHSGKFDVAQSTTAPQGFNYSQKLTVNTTKASLSTYDQSGIWYILEGYDSADKLNWGTSNAQDITLSFYVRSSVTGTYSVGVRNTGTYNKSFVSEYTINTADTWERKTINISGETSGTWATTSSGSVEIFFSCGTGTGYQSSTLDSWEGTSDLSSSNNVNLVATSGATFYITGVQLEVGEVATPFEHRSYGEELALCQRYYYRHADYAERNGNGPIGLISFWTTTAIDFVVSFPCQMRAAPTIQNFTGSTDWIVYRGSANVHYVNTSGLNLARNGRQTVHLNGTVATAGTAGQTAFILANTSGTHLSFDAEL